MITTKAPLRPVDDPAAREAAVRAELNAEAAHVMHTSQPTPTQAEMDAIRSGLHHPRPDRQNPRMAPVEEQRARLAHAATPLYDTRQMTAARPADAASIERRERRDAEAEAEREAAEKRAAEEEAERKRDERDRQHEAAISRPLHSGRATTEKP